EKTAIRIGPVQGVQPSEKAIPIIKEPIKPVGRFLKLIFFSFIKKSNFKIPVITSPKKTIKIAPICLIKPSLSYKNSPIKLVENPNNINILENPIKKQIV